MAMTHYTELLESKGLVLARADSISPQLISPAEVCLSLDLLLISNCLFRNPCCLQYMHTLAAMLCFCASRLRGEAMCSSKVCHTVMLIQQWLTCVCV